LLKYLTPAYAGRKKKKSKIERRGYMNALYQGTGE
jgi:hypothetical protein